jgi:hypothetical protein
MSFVPIRRLSSILPVALAATASAAAAQSESSADWLAQCERQIRRDGDRACDVRETTIPARSRLRVDGGQNGGISVHGWDRNEIKVVARIEAQARSEADAGDLVERVRIETAAEIHATGPRTRDREGWWVSFDLYVPRRTDLELETNNGGIRVADVEGTLRFDAVNGGVQLSGLAGDVRGATENGGVRVALDGDRWHGAGLDVRTQNGGVTLEVPRAYNADLETGTVNGRFDIDFPITVSGRLDRTISARLGSGGPPVRVRTQNGGVRVRQR